MTDDPAQQRENARIGYQVAAQLWAYEGQGVWSMFNAMLVANSIVVAAEGASSKFVEANPALLWILPAFGLVLSILWYALVDRGFTVHSYRVLAARDLEQDIKPVKTVAEGAKFNAGHPVTFSFEAKPFQLSFVARLMRGRELALLVILLFAGFHVVALCLVAASHICGGKMTCDPRWFTTVGLVLDVIGVILLAVAFVAAGLPGPATDRLKQSWLARIGLASLLIGLVLQAIGSWPK